MRNLGSLEAEIMQALWQAREPLTVGDLVDDLQTVHPVAYTTVMTVLERLRVKGRVDRSKVGRSFRYSAALTADDYVSGLLTEALNEATDRTSALARFAGTLSSDDAAALRAALARTRRQTPR